MKKRIVSMILALSMMLSILPVSAFADAGLSSAAAEETNSITYGSVSEHEDVGTNSETNNQVVKIRIGNAGLPMALTGTGWSYDDATKNLLITGVEDQNTEYILDGEVSCKTIICNAAGATVYLLDGVVTGKLLLNGYGVYVLDGSYADVELNGGTVDGGTYDKLTEKDGYVRGGYFRDISGLSDSTQQQAHKLLLPENCTLNGRKETGDIYIVKKYDYSGTGKKLELVVESDTPCEGWAVATTSSNGGVMTLPAGVTDYNFTYNGNVIAKISISADGRTLSASFSMIPMSDEAPMKLVTIPSMSKELSFTDEGLPDLTGVTCVESLDEGEYKLQAYLCRNWTYACYPNIPNSRGILTMADQGGREIDFKELSTAPINCAVQLTNATITDAAFGEKGALELTSGKITGGTYPEARVGISTTDGTGKVEITGGVFDSLSCYGECTISNAVILDCMFSTFFDNSKFAVSDTVFGALPDDLEGALAAGQKISKLVVRNGNVTAINGRNLTLSTNTIYLVGAGTADITLDTDVLSINEEAVENYNSNTSAAGKVLRITGNNDGKDILVNKSTDVGAVKPLRITEDGLPDLTGVEPKKVTGEGMEITLYEGQGWKYAIMSGKDESGVQRTASQILITSPDGNPVDLTSSEINPSQAALKSDGITLQDVTVTSMYADAPVELNNAVIESGYFQKEVTLDATSTIAGGVFDATVKLRDKAKITAGVFHDIKLPNDASKAVVIENAVILGSLTGNNSEAAVSDTVSLSRIDSAYLAAGQQQSELRSMDGVMTDVNGNSVADVAAVYRIGDAGMVLTFTKPVTNINGKPVSAYNGAQLSPDGKTLYLNGRNDGADIVVNQTGETTEKLPFSSLTKEDFVIDWSTLVPGITCKKDGVGKPSVVFVRTYDKKEFDHFPSQDEYGNYKVYIRAEEGTLYEGGELQIDEGTRPYKPTSADFSLDLDTGTAIYTGPKYFGDVAPQATLKYSATNDFSTATETVPTKVGTYYVWLVVEGSRYYDGSNDPLPDGYTVAEKLPFEGFTAEDFETIDNEDGTYTLICTKADGVGELSLKAECITGENKGKTFINREPDEDAYGRYRGTITAKEGKKYKAGSIELGEESLPYEPEAADFTYDAATNKVKYTGRNYYDADPTHVTLLYGTDLSETVPTAPGSYDVYVRVDGDENYYNSTTEKVGTYVVPEQTKPKYYYYWNTQEGKECEVGAPITLGVDKKEGNNVIWKIEGLAEDAYTITDTGTQIELQFFMPGNDVRVTNHYEPIYYTLTVDGKEERRAFGKEVTFTAPEKEGHTFTGWEVDGVPEGTDTSKATITFTMPANNVTLTPQYKKNTYTLTVDGKDEPRVFDEDVTVIAQPVEGKTFTGWKVTGLPTDVDTSKATITFKMPANKVTLKAEYTEKAPETYELKVTDAKVTLKDGSAVADLNAVPVGTELVVTAPEKAGYTFDGWEKDGLPADANIDGATITFKMPANKVTLNAKYIANAPETYELKVTDAQVTLKDGGAVADLTAVPAGTELVATAPEKEGYTFTGWTATGLPANANIDGATVTFKMPANKVTLNAKYIANAELKVTDAKVTLKDGSAVADLTAVPVGTELVVTAPEKVGYTFDGWEKNGLPADANIDGANITFKMPANNVTLKAKYTENAPETYELKVTDAKVTLKDGSAVADLTAVPVGTELVVTAPEKVGYTFDGWEKNGLPADANIDGANITFKMPANNVTLKAKYTENAPETYELKVTDATVTLKDGGAVADLNAVPVGTELVATAPEKEGYTFDSWEKDGLPADANIDGATITFKMPANNVTLKAQYTEIVPEKYTVTMGEEVTEYAVDADVSITAPEKDGYTFTGWEKEGLPADAKIDGANITFKMPANNVTLTPQYEKNTYTLTVDGKDEQRTFDEEVTVTAPKKDGYTFTGWEVTGLPADVDTTKVTISFTMPANNVTLKAQYTEIVPEKYTVTMGEEVTEYAVDADVSITAPAKVGETFTGWDAVGVPEGTDTTSETISFKMPANNVTLTPQYKKDSTPTPAPGGDSDGGGAIVMVAAVGGAAIGVGAYVIGTTAYLKSVLPEGMAIPANRQQLAVALWTAAGKPATQSTALFNDVAADAAELQAIRWVVETGLMTAQDGNFKPGSRVSRLEVIRTWKTYQQRG